METQTLTYEGKTKQGLDIKVDVSFLVGDEIMVNATEMAKPFDKRPETWLKSQRTKDLTHSLAVTLNSETADLIKVKQGGNEKIQQGTWLHRKLALQFAMFLDVNFALWVGDQIEVLMKKGKVELDPNMLAWTSNQCQKALKRKDQFGKRGYAFDKILKTSNPLQLFLTFQATIVNHLNDLTTEDVERQFDSLQRSFNKNGYSKGYLNDTLKWKQVKKQLIRVVKNYNGSTDKAEQTAYKDAAKTITDPMVEQLKKEQEKIIAEQDETISDLKKKLDSVQSKNLAISHIPVPAPQNQLNITNSIQQLLQFSGNMSNQLNHLNTEIQKNEELKQEIAELKQRLQKYEEDDQYTAYEVKIKQLMDTINQLKLQINVREKANEQLYSELEKIRYTESIDYNALNSLPTKIAQYDMFQLLTGEDYAPTVNDRSRMADINKRMSIIEASQAQSPIFYTATSGKKYREFRLGVVVQALINAAKKQMQKTA